MPTRKRGPTGTTGSTGVTGATGPIAPFNLRDELFINAPMIQTQLEKHPIQFLSMSMAPNSAFSLGAIQSFCISSTIGTQFIIPNTLDTTQPVTLIIHCFSVRKKPLAISDFKPTLITRQMEKILERNPPTKDKYLCY